jgi:hypothetical protein
MKGASYVRLPVKAEYDRDEQIRLSSIGVSILHPVDAEDLKYPGLGPAE